MKGIRSLHPDGHTCCIGADVVDGGITRTCMGCDALREQAHLTEQALEQTSQAFADLRYQVSHEGELLDHATTALRLCRQVVRPEHCPACRAASSLAATVLAELDHERTE